MPVFPNNNIPSWCDPVRRGRRILHCRAHAKSGRSKRMLVRRERALRRGAIRVRYRQRFSDRWGVAGASWYGDLARLDGKLQNVVIVRVRRDRGMVRHEQPFGPPIRSARRTCFARRRASFFIRQTSSDIPRISLTAKVSSGAAVRPRLAIQAAIVNNRSTDEQSFAPSDRAG